MNVSRFRLVESEYLSLGLNISEFGLNLSEYLSLLSIYHCVAVCCSVLQCVAVKSEYHPRLSISLAERVLLTIK